MYRKVNSRKAIYQTKNSKQLILEAPGLTSETGDLTRVGFHKSDEFSYFFVVRIIIV